MNRINYLNKQNCKNQIQFINANMKKVRRSELLLLPEKEKEIFSGFDRDSLVIVVVISVCFMVIDLCNEVHNFLLVDATVVII